MNIIKIYHTNISYIYMIQTHAVFEILIRIFVVFFFLYVSTIQLYLGKLQYPSDYIVWWNINITWEHQI